MEKTGKSKKSATEKKGGKAARIKRIRKGHARTQEVREANSDMLYGEKDVK